MTPKLTLVEELRALVPFVAKSQRARYLELLELLVQQAQLPLQEHPVRAHWARYRAQQEFLLRYVDRPDPLVLHGLETVAAHLRLSVATVRQRLAKGHGSFTTRTGVEVQRA